jgi:outer membrane protein OmpA-like peptidoglycan-associated protein
LLDDLGSVTVSTARTTHVLSTPYATATVHDDGRVQAGTTTPADVQARYGAVLATVPEPGTAYTLYFTTGTSVLTPESQAEVPALLAEVTRRGAAEVELTGHSSQSGTDADNDRLSRARAEAVRQILTQQGLQTTFVRVVGRGSRAPLVDRPGQDTPINRRVEVLIR